MAVENDPWDWQTRSRRWFLRSLTSAGVVSTAGCSGLSGPNPAQPAATTETTGGLEAQLAAKEERIRELEVELERRNTTIETIRAEKDELKAEIDSLESQVQDQNGTITDLQSRLEMAQTEIDRLEQRIDELDTESAEFSEETLQTAQEVGLKARRAVVDIWNPAGGLGTGFHIGDGFIVTNRHVATPAPASGDYEVQLFGSSSEPYGELVGAELAGATASTDDEPDLALLEAPEAADKPALSYRTTTDLKAEQPLVLVGNPRGIGLWVISIGRFVSYASDVTVGYEPAGNDADMFVSKIPSRSRSSGSPTLTLDGSVVGCLFGGTNNPNVYADAPEKVHTNFLDHPDYDTHVNAAVFDQYFSKWR